MIDVPRRALRQGQRVVGNAVRSVEEGASHLAHQAQGTAHDVGESVSHLAHDAGHRVAEVAGEARDAAMQLAGQANMRGRRVVRGAGRQIMRAERGIEGTMRENPLVLGAVAIAIGAAIGLALPSSHIEDEWMGDAKERLVRRAEETASEAIHGVEGAVAGQLSAAEKNDSKQEKNGKAEHKNGLSTTQSGSKSQAV